MRLTVYVCGSALRLLRGKAGPLAKFLAMTPARNPNLEMVIWLQRLGGLHTDTRGARGRGGAGRPS